MTLQQKWHRIRFEIPPWAWHSDPYLEGMTEDEFNYLLSLDELPQAEQQQFGRHN